MSLCCLDLCFNCFDFGGSCSQCEILYWKVLILAPWLPLKSLLQAEPNILFGNVEICSGSLWLIRWALYFPILNFAFLGMDEYSQMGAFDKHA